MRIGVEGVMPMYANTVAEIVESIESTAFRQVNDPRLPRTTVAFECADGDADATAALVKSSLRATTWGKSHVFYVKTLA